MKKLSAMILISVLLLAIPVAMAEDDTQDIEVELETESTGSNVGAGPVAAAMAEKVQIRLKARTVEECVRMVKDQYPRAQPERIRNACARALSKSVKTAAGADGSAGANDNSKAVKATPIKDAIKEKMAQKNEAGSNANNKVALRIAAIAKGLKGKDRITDMLSELDRDKIEKFAALSRERQVELSKMTAEQVKAQLGNIKIKKIRLDDLAKKRQIAQQALLKARERYQNAVRKYDAAKDRYQERKQNFISVKEKLENCEDKYTEEECAEFEQEAVDRAKEFLTNSVDMAIAHLEKVRESVEQSELIDGDEVDDILSDIDQMIDDLNALYDDIDAAESKEDIQSIVDALRNLWVKVEARARVHAGRLINDKVGEIIVRSEHLEDRLDCALSGLEEQGIDTSDIEDLVNQFSDKIESARENWDMAQDYFEDARAVDIDSDDAAEDARELVDLGKEAVKQAHEDLKEANELLKNIHREIRAEGGNVTSCAEGLGDDEVYVVVSSDDDSEDEEEEESAEDNSDDAEDESDDSVSGSDDSEDSDVEDSDDSTDSEGETGDASSDDSSDDDSDDDSTDDLINETDSDGNNTI